MLQMSLAAVKSKISTHCGTRPEDMTLSLKDESGQSFAQLKEDHRPLGYYSPYDGYLPFDWEQYCQFSMPKVVRFGTLHEQTRPLVLCSM